MSSTAPIPPGHIARLDGLRAIAVLLVLAVHALVGIQALSIGRVFTFGWTGVDLFFALSGFLITRILLKSREDAGYFKSFYARRVLRIWPLYFVVLALAFLVVPRLPQPELRFGTDPYPFWPCALFIQNYVFADLGP
jgi:peptidoglycan/LPS O-acetylase OafA/YrhL